MWVFGVCVVAHDKKLDAAIEPYINIACTIFAETWATLIPLCLHSQSFIIIVLLNNVIQNLGIGIVFSKDSEHGAFSQCFEEFGERSMIFQVALRRLLVLRRQLGDLCESFFCGNEPNTGWADKIHDAW